MSVISADTRSIATTDPRTMPSMTKRQLPTITKEQEWDARVLSMIWRKRNKIDAETISKLKGLHENAKRHHRYNVSTYTYSFPSHSVGQLGYGRMFSLNQKGSLETLTQTVRHSLCANIYWDIDMVNAQPTLLVQVAAKHNIQVPELQKYVSRREDCLEQLMKEFSIDRKDAKEWVIKYIFGSKARELEKLSKEMQALSNALFSEYQELYEAVCLLKEANTNRMGSFLAYLAQSEEHKCLMVMNRFFEEVGRKVGVLNYDGLQIYIAANETEFPISLLRACEARVFQETGYTIQLDIKPMTICDDFIPTGRAILYKYEVNDTYMAKKFIAHMGPHIKRDSEAGVLVYDIDTGLWSGDESTLRKMMANAGLAEDTPEGLVDYSGFAHKQEQILKLLPSFIAAERFIDTAIENSKGHLLFQDGIYSTIDRSFTHDFNPAMFFCSRIDRPFPEKRDEERIRKINKLVFEDPFLAHEQEVGVYYKQLLARAIAGHYEDKTFIVGVGTANSGKGVLSSALQGAFGSFIGDFQADVFKMQKFNSQDAAKQLSWIQTFCNKRLAISNEAGPDGVYNGVIIKIVASGGDTITTRRNYQDEITVINRATMLMLCNDIPNIHPLDAGVSNRLVIIEYKLSFVESPSQPHERRIDPGVRDMFYATENRDAFFWLLMDAYRSEKPARCCISMASAAEWVPAPTTSFKEALSAQGYFIDLKDDEAMTPVSELKTVLMNNGVAKGMSDTAIGRELGRLGLDSIIIKQNGKTIRCRKFIKQNEVIT